jgi:hypothetical protein
MIAAFAGSALAWEFSMTGQHEWRYTYFARAGDMDLFGYAPLENLFNTGDYIGFAGPTRFNNGAIAAAAGVWAITRGGHSTWGSEAAWYDSKLSFKPTVRVNKAIRVHGTYYIGGIRNRDNFAIFTPQQGEYYVSQTRASANDGIIANWDQVRATVQVPWGVFSYGVKDFPLGIGSFTSYNFPAESFLTVVPYGPFRFLFAIWPNRGPNWDVDTQATGNEYFVGPIMTYDNGPLSLGAGGIFQAGHENGFGTGVIDGRGNRDTNVQTYITYLKYNNGRFFANAQYVWVNQNRHEIGIRPAFVENYQAVAEIGTVVGPSKLSLLWAQAGGPVMRGGPEFGVPVGAPVNPTKIYGGVAIDYQMMEPYEFLMFSTYGGGNQTFSPDRHGELNDGYALAARLDYAVASNLNVFGSYIWAHRLERNGTYFGQYNQNGTDLGLPTFGTVANGGRDGTANSDPFVTDGFLGYEIGLGVDWKLLEGMTFRSRYAYWQPGDWFDEAYQAIINVAGGAPVVGFREGRDPIHGFRGSLLIDF